MDNYVWPFYFVANPTTGLHACSNQLFNIIIVVEQILSVQEANNPERSKTVLLINSRSKVSVFLAIKLSPTKSCS